MAKFSIQQSQIDTRTGEVHAQFLFFADEIVIHNQAIETIISEPQNPLYGYGAGPQSTSDQITYIPVSQSFSGLVVYPLKSKGNEIAMFDNKIVLNPNAVYIKVLKDGRDFIKTGGGVQKIEADDETWNLVEGYKAQKQSYLGLNFYYFELKGTN